MSEPLWPDGTVRLPDALESWLDGHFEGDKHDDADLLTVGRNATAVALWSLIHRQGDSDTDQAALDAIAAVAGSATPTRCHECDGRGHTWEFSRDGYMTCDWCGGSGEESEAPAGSATPIQDEDNIGRRLSDFGEHLLKRGPVAGSATPTDYDDNGWETLRHDIGDDDE
jgi:hypothetical protein